MTLRTIFLSLVLASVLGGCVSSNLTELRKADAEFLKELAKDQASVSVSIKTIYGTIQYCRTAVQNGNMSCDSNGINVQSERPQLSVPITITPNVQMGQPTMSPAPK